MKTLVIDSKTDLNTLNKKDDKPSTGNPVTDEKNNPHFVAGNQVNRDSVKAPEPAKAEAKPQEPASPEALKAEAAPQVQAPKVAEAPKPALNLDGTIRIVEDLQKKMRYRVRLIGDIETLDAFEIGLKDEEEDEHNDRNFYQGCELTIKDGKGRVFATKNATVIWTVSQMMCRLFEDKLAEIEAGIVLPA